MWTGVVLWGIWRYYVNVNEVSPYNAETMEAEASAPAVMGVKSEEADDDNDGDGDVDFGATKHEDVGGRRVCLWNIGTG